MSEKEVKEVECKFYQTYKEAKQDKNYFRSTVEIENINYPAKFKVDGIIFHPREIKRSIPVYPFELKEVVYVRGAN